MILFLRSQTQKSNEILNFYFILVIYLQKVYSETQNPSADLPQQLKVPQCNSYWVHVVALWLCSNAVIG